MWFSILNIEAILCFYISFCIKLPRKMCESYINSMEKCAECDNIRYEKCEITAKYPMKNVE